MRLAVVALVIAAIALVASFRWGGALERAEIAVEDAVAETGAARAETKTSAALAVETDAFAARRERLTLEAEDGAREILAHAGADALVDPGLAHLAVCRVERLRGAAPFHCTAGDDSVDGEPALEPVPARPLAEP